jgi:hypothetical protein
MLDALHVGASYPPFIAIYFVEVNIENEGVSHWPNHIHGL